MRKSLGDKRKQISDAQIDHITRVYGDALAVAADPRHPDHGRVKVFATRDFGYQRITVERPLKQRFELTDDTLAALESSKPLAKWDGRDALIDALRNALGSSGRRSGGRGGPAHVAMAGGRCGRELTPRGEGHLDGRGCLRSRRRGADDQGHSAAGPGPARLRERPARRGRRTRTSPARSSPTSPTPGSTTTRPRSATRSPSPATSTSTRRRARSPRSTRNSATWRARSRSCWAR